MSSARVRCIGMLEGDSAPSFPFPRFGSWRRNSSFVSRLDACRKIFGLAIGLAPKAKIFSTYIDIEYQLGNIERCRTLYEKYLEIEPQNCSTWIKYADLEHTLGEVDRVRSIYELAVDQGMLDMPEVLWKAYIDFETSEGERDKTRAL